MALVLHAETLWVSPYVFSSWVALREKNLPFAVRELSLIEGENRAPAYVAQNLTGKVSALEHDGFCLSESSAIAEYLDEVFPRPEHPGLFPPDPRDRARARALMAWFRSDLGALRDERPTVTMFFAQATRPLSPAGAASAAALLRLSERVIRSEDTGLFGNWCLADSELAFMLHRLILNEHKVPVPVRAWAAREWQRRSVQEFVRHPRPATLDERYWAIPANQGATRPYL